ncbi:transmembrane alpha-helix domain-containing protein [Purpureocillium lavendulum]|uniref:Transmembrane alpha-helix domain-containing protein n=1 Tax=Purpureocillium lavendulum TaxID=1247861 RepID=A0AB34FJR8_9HYPO|nr:transmembrane alpha-helix domain-containing protein [Purpureocillium lavendulum]
MARAEPRSAGPPSVGGLAMATTTTALALLLLLLLLRLQATMMILPGLLLGGATPAAADFVHPPPWVGSYSYQDNPRYEWGRDITVEWKLYTSSVVELVFVLDYPRRVEHVDNATFVVIAANITSKQTSTIWNVTLLGNEDLVPSGMDALCYFCLNYAGTDVEMYSTSYFNVSLPRRAVVPPPVTPTRAAAGRPKGQVTEGEGPMDTLTMDTMTGEVTTTTTTTTAIASTATGTSMMETRMSTMATMTRTGATPSATSTPHYSPDLSHGAVAGIGVGATLGCISILAGLGFVLWRRRWKTQRMTALPAPVELPQPPAPPPPPPPPPLRPEPPPRPASVPMLVLPDFPVLGGWDKRDTWGISELDGGQNTFAHEKP